MHSRPTQNSVDHFDWEAYTRLALGCTISAWQAGHIRGEGWRSVDWNCSIKWTYGGGAGPLNCLGPQAPGHRSSPFRTHCDKFLGTTCGKIDASANFQLSSQMNQLAGGKTLDCFMHLVSASQVGQQKLLQRASIQTIERWWCQNFMHQDEPVPFILLACF